jgi:hypothetical protein
MRESSSQATHGEAATSVIYSFCLLITFLLEGFSGHRGELMSTDLVRFPLQLRHMIEDS